MSQFKVKALMAATLLTAIWPFDSRADEPTIMAGLKMGASQATVLEQLELSCDSVSEVSYHEASYPLASESELHYVCDGYLGGPIRFDRAAFVIADGRFVQAEAEGIDLDSASSALGQPDGVYLGMNNYREGTIWLDAENQKLFWLSEDARHPNLFAWSNPVLYGLPPGNEVRSTEIPDLIDFSASLDELRPLFEAQCPQIVVHENERVWLPNEPAVQVQIDCFGIAFAGFPRKFEAVFGDGKLEVIWVLTGKPEEARMRELLIRDWGKPTLVTDSWEVFGDGRISLYKDKPEFLILSDDMIPLYQQEFSAD